MAEKKGKQRALGPSGFVLLEYRGADKDHSAIWLEFKKLLRGSILTHRLDTLVGDIIDFSARPEVPPINKDVLMKNAPKKTIISLVEAEPSREKQSSAQEDDKKSVKVKSSASELAYDISVQAPREVENPYYETEHAIFMDEYRALNKKRVERVCQLDRDLEVFYTVMWMQCGLSMQNFIKRMKDYDIRCRAKDAFWLYKAIESVCINTAAVEDTDSKTNTFFALAGIQMYSHNDIHAHFERWRQAYAAYVASGNQALDIEMQVDMLCRSLHDGYAEYKAEYQNRKNRRLDLPGTLEQLLWEASRHVVVVSHQSNDRRAVYAIGDARAFKKADNNAKSSKVKGTTKKFSPKNRDKHYSKLLDDKEYWKDKTCHSCRKLGHCAARCPEVSKAAAESDAEDEVDSAAAKAPAAAVTFPLKSAMKKKIGNYGLLVAWTGVIPSRYLIALDNCAYSTVICNEEYISDIIYGKCAPLLSWIGESHTNDASGMFHPFGYCELNKLAPINLLSEFEVRARFNIEERWDGPGPSDGVMRNPDWKIVHVGGIAIAFQLDKDTRQYVVDWRTYQSRFTYSPRMLGVHVVINSVRQNEAMFTKDEIRRAKLAREFIARTGYASKEDVMRLVSSAGNIINVEITRADVQRAVDIYGEQHVLQGRSRIIRPDTRIVRANPIPKPVQMLYCDTLFIGGIPFMLCKVKPLDLLMIHHLHDGQSEKALLSCFVEFVSTLESYKYDTEVLYSDADKAALANINKLSRVRIENCAAGDHVNEAESNIKTVKERFRSVRAGVVFELTNRLIIELVFYIVGRINSGISQYSSDGLCPRVRLTGVLLDTHKDFRTGFGSLVLARNKNIVSNDPLQVRCEVCLTLRPIGNKQGSWRMLKLTNGRVVSRSQFKEVPMTDLALSRLKELAVLENKGQAIVLDDELEYEEPNDVNDIEDFFHDRALRNAHFDFPFFSDSMSNKSEGGGVSIKESSVQDIEVEEYKDIEIEEVEDVIADSNTMHVGQLDEVQVSAPPSAVSAPPSAAPTPMYSNKAEITDTGRASYKSTAADREARRTARGGSNSVNLIAGRRISTKKRYNKRNTYVPVGNYNVSRSESAKKYGAQNSMRAQYKEIKALYENGTFEGILPKDLTGSQKRRIIRSFIILREKFNAEGDFEKLKARLVANGAQMDLTSLTDLSSPTVSLTFLLMMVVIAARERRSVATMDVGNAFVKASMEGEEEVLVTLDQVSAALLIQIDPTYEMFLNDKLEMTVKLKKALYGCLQSARLWFELLVEKLMEFGYVQNTVDPCVLNKTVAGKQSTLLLHVDDIMVLSQIPEEITNLYSHLESKFGKVSLHEGVKHNYLGMTFDFSSVGKVTITMLGYETDLVADWSSIDFTAELIPSRDKPASTPATNLIFEKGESPMLSTEHSAIFHSYVMRLAFLAKRVKPELSVAVSYLSTQVTRSTEHDLRKLDRVIRYVRDHLGSGITLFSAGSGSHIVVTAHIDASFGCHDDGKSHTGVNISLGQGPVYVRSVKQRIVTKSSTEAELVALSDEAGLVFHIEDFLLSQGYSCDITIGQDNQSTIDMITTHTKQSMRTKHIKVRYFWLRERVEEGELSIVYVPTGNMLADMLTKPMQGRMFHRFANLFCSRDEVVPEEE